MNDLDELLRTFHTPPPDETRPERIADAVMAQLERTPVRSGGRARRRLLVALPVVALLVLGALLIGPVRGGGGNPESAFAQAIARVQATGTILHIRATTRVANVRGSVDPLALLRSGTSITSESWSTTDGYLRVSRVGRIASTSTVTPVEHVEYRGDTHTLTVSRWASPAERRADLDGLRLFDPQQFLRSPRRALVHYIGTTTWRGQRALRFSNHANGLGLTILVAPKTYRPLVVTQAYRIRGGESVIQTVYTRFEMLPRTPSNERLLQFTPPRHTTILRNDPVAYAPVAIAGKPPKRTLALLRELARLQPQVGQTPTSTRLGFANPPIVSQIHAAAVVPLPAGAGQWVLYEAPRKLGGKPCYAFAENRRDGRNGLGGSWSCPDAHPASYAFGPSVDHRAWILGGHVSNPITGQSRIQRIALTVGTKTYTVPIRADGFYLAAVPATTSVTLHRYLADGTQLPPERLPR